MSLALDGIVLGSSLFDNLRLSLLDAAREFYRNEAKAWLRYGSVEAYCRQTSQRLSQEQRRCRQVLGEEEAREMVTIVGEELVRRHLETLVYAETGIRSMVRKRQTEELRLLAELADRFTPRNSTGEVKRGEENLNLVSYWEARILQGEQNA
jgi:hypothetical protein